MSDGEYDLAYEDDALDDDFGDDAADAWNNDDAVVPDVLEETDLGRLDDDALGEEEDESLLQDDVVENEEDLLQEVTDALGRQTLLLGDEGAVDDDLLDDALETTDEKETLVALTERQAADNDAEDEDREYDEDAEEQEEQEEDGDKEPVVATDDDLLADWFDTVSIAVAEAASAASTADATNATFESLATSAPKTSSASGSSKKTSLAAAPATKTQHPQRTPPPPQLQRQQPLQPPRDPAASYNAARDKYERARRRLPDAHDFEAQMDELTRMMHNPRYKPNLDNYSQEPAAVQETTMLAAMHQCSLRASKYQTVEASQSSSSSAQSTAPSSQSMKQRRVDEYTVQSPHSVFVGSRFTTDNIIPNQFTMQAKTSFYQWRAFCTIHERMKRRGLVLMRGYPPMDLNAFARTFWMSPMALQRSKPVAWVDRSQHTYFRYDSSASTGVAGAAARNSATNPQAAQTPPPPPLPHDQLYLRRERRDDYTLDMMNPVIDVLAIQQKLAMYFVKESMMATDQRPIPDAYVEPVFRDPSVFQLRRTSETACVIHVVFLPGCDIRSIAKYLAYERVSNVLRPTFMHNASDEATLRPISKPLPIDELFAVVDKEPNAAFRTKIQALHATEMPVEMRCVLDVWAQENLWVNPMRLQMVDRIELSSQFPAHVEELLREGKEAEALAKALTYRKMDCNDIPARFIGLQPGNFVRVWKTATKNSAPQFHIVVRV